jgi:proteinaceous RNase P
VFTVVLIACDCDVQSENRLWATPKGSNDDWYWLYGAVSKGEKGILVSNDKLRDHIFDLLRPRFFLKWRDNQKCMYTVTTHSDRSISAEVLPPPCFTTCVQKVEESNAWMFPMGEEQWLCARPL